MILTACVAAFIAESAAATAADGTILPAAEVLPQVPPGFEISVFASEPLLYKPTSLCFDARGRVMVGQGPQYHLAESIDEADSVILLLDTDGDEVADQRKVFATGFNSIQGLAWKGRDLYVANSPELTVVRDLDGDDVADQYVVIYTDLGNHEHALHGLIWGPDGRLYMSKGNSKGHNQPDQFGRVAPRAFRELWDVVHPSGAPDIAPPRTFNARNYRKTWHDPHDDWGREGGVLRCDPLGANLEIVARGMRNPWDIAMDNEFNWLGTDNDQTQGDRIIMPFFGGHFGWGHRYSSHWTGAGNLPTVPVSGPMTSGSWAGIAWYDDDHFPHEYRHVFFINDWMFGTYVYRPGWKGALRESADGLLEPFIQRREGGMLYRPTDLACGPEGAIYTLGWGGNYHYETGQEGSWVFRVIHSENGNSIRLPQMPLARQTVAQLLTALGPGAFPAQRVNAQDELVRRGGVIQEELVDVISAGELGTGQQTWAAWALGRMVGRNDELTETIRKWTVPQMSVPAGRLPRNLRIQAIRILAFRTSMYGQHEALLSVVETALRDPDPRVRFEAMQAIHQADLVMAVDEVLVQLTKEHDRLVFYAGWHALQDLAPVEIRRSWLHHENARVRLAALLGLQEDFAITQKEVLDLVDQESDPTVRSWALTFAMNPIPPEKLSNERLRIEMEQTLPVGQMIERAGEADHPELRELYLRMISRASVREGEQQRQLLGFYRTLESEAERTLVLPAVGTTLDAFPDLWEALGGAESLKNAAIQGIANLHRLRVKQLRSSEASVQATSRSVSSVNNFATEIANRLIRKMADVGPGDERIAGALRALVALPLPTDWSIADDALEVLLTILKSRQQPSIHRRTLRLLGKLKPDSTAGSNRITAVLDVLCQAPDTHLYQDLLAVKAHLGLVIEVPVPEAATVASVLATLDQSDINRGKEVFFDRISGAGCAACHRVRGRGSDLAPDLSGVGIRLTPENMVRAILQPSAAITEGYAMQLLLTTSGRTYTGAVINESSSAITILRTDGTRVRIEVGMIEARKILNQSVMPKGYELFGTEQLADLTAWLLTLRDRGNGIDAEVAK